jgi:hypothetical protein
MKDITITLTPDELAILKQALIELDIHHQLMMARAEYPPSGLAQVQEIIWDIQRKLPKEI